jgi:hypothetical protein
MYHEAARYTRMQWLSLLLREETVMYDDYGVDVNAIVANLDRREAMSFDDADAESTDDEDDGE